MSSDEIQRFLAFCRLSGTMIATSTQDGHKIVEFPCRHALGARPTSGDMEVLAALPQGDRGGIGMLYGDTAEAELFIVDGSPGIILVPPEDWRKLAKEVAKWRKNGAQDLDHDELAMLDSAIFFGRIPRASTFFLLVQDGELAGHVAMFTGPGLELWSIAESFDAFLAAIPKNGVSWIKADTRYINDGSREQFFPSVYRIRDEQAPRQADFAPTVRCTLRVALWSRGKKVPKRYTFEQTTTDRVEIEAPSGRVYSLIVEFYDDDRASVTVDDEQHDYFRLSGAGRLHINVRLNEGDLFSGEIGTPEP